MKTIQKQYDFLNNLRKKLHSPALPLFLELEGKTLSDWSFSREQVYNQQIRLIGEVVPAGFHSSGESDGEEGKEDRESESQSESENDSEEQGSVNEVSQEEQEQEQEEVVVEPPKRGRGRPRRNPMSSEPKTKPKANLKKGNPKPSNAQSAQPILRQRQDRPSSTKHSKVDTSNKIKGLTLLTQVLRQKILNNNPMTQKQLTQLVYAEQAPYLQQLVPQKRHKQQLNLKRRIYDAMNVLKNANVFKKKDKKVYFVEDSDPEIVKCVGALKKMKQVREKELKIIEKVIQNQVKMKKIVPFLEEFENQVHYNIQEDKIWDLQKMDSEIMDQVDLEFNKTRTVQAKGTIKKKYQTQCKAILENLQEQYEKDISKNQNWIDTIPEDLKGSKDVRERYQKMSDTQQMAIFMKYQIDKLVLQQKYKKLEWKLSKAPNLKKLNLKFLNDEVDYGSSKNIKKIIKQYLPQQYPDKEIDYENDCEGEDYQDPPQIKPKSRIMRTYQHIPFPSQGFITRGDCRLKFCRKGFTITSKNQLQHLNSTEIATLLFEAPEPEQKQKKQ